MPTMNSPRESRATLVAWSSILLTGLAPKLHARLRVSDSTRLETEACGHLEDDIDVLQDLVHRPKTSS